MMRHDSKAWNIFLDSNFPMNRLSCAIWCSTSTSFTEKDCYFKKPLPIIEKRREQELISYMRFRMHFPEFRQMILRTKSRPAVGPLLPPLYLYFFLLFLLLLLHQPLTFPTADHLFCLSLTAGSWFMWCSTWVFSLFLFLFSRFFLNAQKREAENIISVHCLHLFSLSFASRLMGSLEKKREEPSQDEKEVLLTKRLSNYVCPPAVFWPDVCSSRFNYESSHFAHVSIRRPLFRETGSSCYWIRDLRCWDEEEDE